MRADAVVSVVRWVTGTQRGYLALAAVASVVALASALVMQYGFGLPPCDLCIEQRWGFAGAGVLAAGGLLVHRIGVSLRAMVAAVACGVPGDRGTRVSGTSAWSSNGGRGPIPARRPVRTPRQPMKLLDAIMNAPLVRCDEIPASLLGLSIAGWVVVSALAMTALAVVVLTRSRRVVR